MSRHGIAGQFD